MLCLLNDSEYAGKPGSFPAWLLKEDRQVSVRETRMLSALREDLSVFPTEIDIELIPIVTLWQHYSFVRRFSYIIR
jgi:hypothetical protein